MAAAMTVILCICAESLVALISGSSEQVVIYNSALYVKITGPFYAALGMLLQTRFALQGIGEKLLPLISSVIEMLVKVCFVLLLIPRFDFMAVIFCEPVAWCLMSIQLLYAFYNNPVIKQN